MKTRARLVVIVVWLQCLSVVHSRNVTLLDTTENTTSELLSSWNYYPSDNSWTVMTITSTGGVPWPIFSTICDAGQAQSSWLRSPWIQQAGVNRYHVETHFSMRECSSIPSLVQCKQYFNVYYVETNASKSGSLTLPPDASLLKQVSPSSTVYADQYTQPGQEFLTNLISNDVPVSSPGNGFYLLIQAPTACVALTSIRVYYSLCDAVQFNLISLPSTHTGRTLEYPFPSVNPQCTNHASWNSSLPGSASTYSFMCVNNGVWVASVSQTVVNVSADGSVSNADRFPLWCSCYAGYAPDYRYVNCSACPVNTYKSSLASSPCSACPANSRTLQTGSTACVCNSNYYRTANDPVSAACSSSPSPPYQLAYAASNGNAFLLLSWSQPINNGGRSDLFYTVSYTDSQSSQTNFGLLVSGSSSVSPLSLGIAYAFATNATSVNISGLLSSRKYTISVKSWNGVSQQAAMASSLNNEASVAISTSAALPCILDGVSFLASGSNWASVAWSASSSASADCQSVLNIISLFEVRLWASTSSNRRRRDATLQQTDVQYYTSGNSSLSATVQLPAGYTSYAVQLRALAGNAWTTPQTSPVALQVSTSAAATTITTEPPVQQASVAQASSSVIAISVGVTVAVLVVVSMISAFFIVQRKRYRRRKCAAEFHKFRRTSDDQMSASSGSSRSSASQQAAVMIGPPIPSSRSADGKLAATSDDAHCSSGNPLSRDSVQSHNYICGLVDSSTLCTTLPTNGTLCGNVTCSSEVHNTTPLVTPTVPSCSSNNDAPMQISNHSPHESCSCVSNSYPGTHTNSAFRVYVDPHTYEDPNLLIKTFATELQVDSIVLEKVIGSGEFGDVCFGRLNVAMNAGKLRVRATAGETTVAVAIKTLKQENKTEKSRQDFLLEASILGQFEHPNILRLVGVVTRAQPLMIVTEFMQNGSLDVYLRAHRASRTFSVRQRTDMLFDVVNGMKYLADRGVIHRDLAARNILIDENLTCKVSDFGLSRKLHGNACKNNSVSIDENVYRARGGKIPVRWTAPEAIQYRTFNHACDVWSFGVLSWETLLFGERPFWNWSNHDALAAVSNGFRLPRLDDMPDVLHTMMLECWQVSPQDRPTFSDLLDYLSELHKHDDSVFLEEVSASSNLQTNCVCRESWWAIQNIVSQHEMNAERRGRRANEILLTDSEIDYLNHLSRQTCIQHWLYTVNLHRFSTEFEEKARITTVEQLCTAVNDWGNVRSLGLSVPSEYEEVLSNALHRWWQSNSDTSSARSVQSTSVTSSERVPALQITTRTKPSQGKPLAAEHSSFV